MSSPMALEYASSVWDPHHNNHIISVEKVQRRAIRWIYNDYDYSHSVTTMLQNLDWPTLQLRRKRKHIIFMHHDIDSVNVAVVIGERHISV